jgi:signal transduction histidine kinase
LQAKTWACRPPTLPTIPVDIDTSSVSPGVTIATGDLAVEREIVGLCRQVRALAASCSIRDEDVRSLSVALYEAARALRRAGANGSVELRIVDGAWLQVMIRTALASRVADAVPDIVAPLRAMVRDLRVTTAADEHTLTVCMSVPCGSLAEAPGAERAQPGTLEAIAGEAREEQLRQALADLQAELDETNRGAVALYLELHRRAEELAAANRAKEDFLATLSHELRTPLNAMLGWTRLLRTGKLDRPGVERALDTIERNARHQAQLIADMLDMSRIVTGRLRLDVRRVELAPLLEAAIDAVRPAADGKGVSIQTDIRQGGCVNGDPDRLQQVVWNLLTNGIKFTPAAGRITVSLVQIGRMVVTTVTDTGEGIAPELLPVVFDRFRQGDASVTRPHGGLGLGLSIVRHLVELHGGRVQVASDGPGRGASFSVHLPAA